MRIANFDTLQGYVKKYASQYLLADPFPHIVIDNFFSSSQINFIRSTFPLPDSAVWKTPENIHTISKSVIKRGITGFKENVINDDARYIFNEFNSATFIDFLSKLSGISGLCSDPYLNEAGFHFSSNNGKLNIHADYSHHDKIGLERRLNFLLFLNENWERNFQGNLGLYDKKFNLVKSYMPINNRVIIFSTSKDSYHGFPDSIKMSESYIREEYGRKSIAMYYYTLPSGREKHPAIFPQDPSFSYIPSKN